MRVYVFVNSLYSFFCSIFKNKLPLLNLLSPFIISSSSSFFSFTLFHPFILLSRVSNLSPLPFSLFPPFISTHPLQSYSYRHSGMYLPSVGTRLFRGAAVEPNFRGNFKLPSSFPFYPTPSFSLSTLSFSFSFGLFVFC